MNEISNITLIYWKSLFEYAIIRKQPSEVKRGIKQAIYNQRSDLVIEDVLHRYSLADYTLFTI